MPINRDEFIAKTAFKKTDSGDYKAIQMPEEQWYNIGEKFKDSNIKGGYKLKSETWYGIHNGKRIVFDRINTTLAEITPETGLVEVMRVELHIEYSFIPNGKREERMTTYQRIPIPGISENAKDLVPDQITKNIIKRFFYDQVSKDDPYRYHLTQIVTQTDMLCAINGYDNNGNPRDPVPVHLQLNGISFKVGEGVTTKLIEGWKIETQSFIGDEIIKSKHEIESGIGDIETTSFNSPPIELNLSEPCTPPFKVAKAVKGNKPGKTIKIENPNLVGGTDQVEEIAEIMLKVNSWVKQIDRVKTYLGIIPIQAIGKSSGNVGYSISVDHMQPIATTTITHREMVEADD